MSTTYRRDYEELGLDEAADWSAARNAYRSLVNIWHPDRYASRPREREHAQQRFIRLARSFDRLRAFYRENGRLPFEKVVPQAPETLRADRMARERTEHRRRIDRAAEVDAALFGDELLDRGARASEAAGGGRPARSPLLWLGAGLCVVAATVALFVVVDGRQRTAAFREGQEVLLETEPSEFMPSATEVRRQSTRGSFVTREDGKLGDQLMEDIFKP